MFGSKDKDKLQYLKNNIKKIEKTNKASIFHFPKNVEDKNLHPSVYNVKDSNTPEDAIAIGRDSPYGNPYTTIKDGGRESATDKGYKLSIKDNSTIEPEMTKEEFFGQLDINPLDYIRVVNVRGNKENQAQPDEKIIAAHRANPTLGNPFVMKDKSDAERDRVIEAYKKHLEKDLIAQGSIYKLLNKIADDIIEKKEKIALSCWCAPQACHAHEIAKVLVLMVAEKRLIQVIEAPKTNLKNKP